MPTLQSSTLPTNTTSASTNNTATPTTTETQSTVIISFKSSQTPVQSQSPFEHHHQQQHQNQNQHQHHYHHHNHHQQQLEHQQQQSTPLHNDDTITETMTPSLANSSHISTTAQMGSPLCTPRTPKNNVLKKVASFTLEKSAGGSANNKINNGDPNSGMLGQLENIGSKRSTFVPEKLSFAAYEKFEGKL